MSEGGTRHMNKIKYNEIYENKSRKHQPSISEVSGRYYIPLHSPKIKKFKGK